MPISKDLKDKAQMTREDGVFTLKLDEGVSLAELVSFAEDMFPWVSTEDIRIWPADDDELVVSVRGGRGVQSNSREGRDTQKGRAFAHGQRWKELK